MDGYEPIHPFRTRRRTQVSNYRGLAAINAQIGRERVMCRSSILPALDHQQDADGGRGKSLRARPELKVRKAAIVEPCVPKKFAHGIASERR